MSTRILVTGGVRSGKSTHAESLLADRDDVTYIATGPLADRDADSEWASRVAEHRRRRPGSWRTVESTDIASVIEQAEGGVIVECLATWVTAILDELEAWESPADAWDAAVEARITDVLEAWIRADGPLVAVTNEAGMGVVPAYRSGRVFRDVLGTVNRRIAAVSDRVDLVVAGRILQL